MQQSPTDQEEEGQQEGQARSQVQGVQGRQQQVQVAVRAEARER
jgi:hypothetical protein